MGRLLTLSLITTILCLGFFFPLVKYIEAKTIGKDKTDCMITYINSYYPYGELYSLEGGFKHIDKRGIDYLDSMGTVNGCDFSQTSSASLVNVPYCYLTLALEGKLAIN